MNQITDYLQKQFSAMVELTEEIINVDSPSNDIAGIQKVADILSAKMREIGMQTRQRDSGKQGMALIGELPGEEGLQPVILLGHMDTVFPKGTVEQRPFKLEKDRMTGPGIFDMKPGLVIGLFAIQALVKLKLNRRLQIRITLLRKSAKVVPMVLTLKGQRTIQVMLEPITVAG